MFDKLYIELGNDELRYIYGSVSGRKINIRQWGTKKLAAGCFINGKVMDESGLIGSLSELKKELKLFRKPVHLTVNDGSFITRPVELPILKEKDISKHLALEAEQYLPISKKSYQVDFRVMGRRNEADDSGSSVMVSAGPKDSIQNILNCFDKCRLDVKVIDAYPNNICRLTRTVREEDFAVIDLGRKNINITIMENNRFYMHSYISADVGAMFENIQSCLYDSYDPQFINNDATQMDERIRDILSGIMGQASRYLDYFNSRHFGRTVDSVYVIGEYGMLKGLKSVMNFNFNTKASIGLAEFDASNTIGNKSFSREQMSYYSLLGMMLRGKKR